MNIVKVTKRYKDLRLDRILNVGEEVLMPSQRAKDVEGAGFGKIMEV